MSLCGPSREITRFGRFCPAPAFRFEEGGAPVGHWSVPFGGVIARYVAAVSCVAVRLNTAAAAPVGGTDPVPDNPISRQVLAGSGLLVVPAHAVCVLARVSQIRKGAIPWNSPGTSPEPVAAAKYPWTSTRTSTLPAPLKMLIPPEGLNCAP